MGMQVYPAMNIRFPENMEAELIHAMKARSVPPWHWKTTNTHGGQIASERVYFHRNKAATDLACTLCMHLESRGNYVVVNIVPDEVTQIPHASYVRILHEFDSLIAEPAAESLGGITSVDVATEKLEDHFSAEEIRRLERFCRTSNASDGGSNLCDQKKWMDFLICVHRKETDVRCDTFGECLKAIGWWPEQGIAKLVREYDFAIRLLPHYEK
jgi:hypothetical protein